MSEDKNERIQQEINKAINFLGQNKFSEAESICNEIINEKDNPDAFHILSSIKIYKQEFDESINLIQKMNFVYHFNLFIKHFIDNVCNLNEFYLLNLNFMY